MIPDFFKSTENIVCVKIKPIGSITTLTGFYKELSKSLELIGKASDFRVNESVMYYLDFYRLGENWTWYSGRADYINYEYIVFNSPELKTLFLMSANSDILKCVVN